MAKEGFMIMQYQCQECRKIEKLYNSRDGVTPFIIPSLCCGEEAQHVNWHEDEYNPNFVPKPGQRVFFTMPRELAVLYARMNLVRWEISDPSPPPRHSELWEEIVTSMADDFYRDGEGHCIITM